MAYAHLAGIDSKLAAQKAALENPLLSTQAHLHSLRLPVMGASLALLALCIIWNKRRRPPETLAAFGETHVEIAPPLLGPAWTSKLFLILLGTAITALFFGRTIAGTALADLGFHRWSSALSDVAFACAFAIAALTVKWSEGAHAHRVSISDDARTGRVTVGWVAPVEEVPNPHTENSEGFGWILRGLPMGFAVVAGLTVVLINLADLVDSGWKDPLASLATALIAGAATVGLLIWSRRRSISRKARTVAVAAIPPKMS